MGINLLPNHSSDKETGEKREEEKKQEVELYIPEELKKEQEQRLKKEKPGFLANLYNFLFVKNEKLKAKADSSDADKKKEKEISQDKKNAFFLKKPKEKKIEEIQQEVAQKIIKEKSDAENISVKKSIKEKASQEKTKTFWSNNKEDDKINPGKSFLDKEKFSQNLNKKAKKLKAKKKIIWQKNFWTKGKEKKINKLGKTEEKKMLISSGEQKKAVGSNKSISSFSSAQKEVSQEIKAGSRKEKIGFKVYQRGKVKIKIKQENFWQSWQKKIKKIFSSSSQETKPEIDFISGGELVASLKIKVKERVSFIVLVSLLMFVILSSLFVLFDWYQTLTVKKWLSVHQEVKDINQKIIADRQQEQKIINFDKKLQAASYLLDHHIYWTLFLQKLKKYTLKGVYYSSVHADQNGNVDLEAYTDDYDNVAKQFKIFQGADDFVSEVKINSASQEGRDKQAGIVKFRIMLKVKKQVFYKEP